ncbi:hypothetical protein CIB84_010364, partial [Bambusicola thoracicus]
EEDLLNDVCREVVEKWSESQIVDAKEKKEDEVQAIASMMEKQARITVKPKEISQEEKQRKAALLAQYANVTDEEEYPFPNCYLTRFDPRVTTGAQIHTQCPQFLNSFTGDDEQDSSTATAVNIGSEKFSVWPQTTTEKRELCVQSTLSALSSRPALFRNTNVEDVLNARKLERELLRDEFQKKKEQDKLQREKDKLAKQERKEKEKKRTQKGERKR